MAAMWTGGSLLGAFDHVVPVPWLDQLAGTSALERVGRHQYWSPFCATCSDPSLPSRTPVLDVRVAEQPVAALHHIPVRLVAERRDAREDGAEVGWWRGYDRPTAERVAAGPGVLAQG